MIWVRSGPEVDLEPSDSVGRDGPRSFKGEFSYVQVLSLGCALVKGCHARFEGDWVCATDGGPEAQGRRG